MKGISHQKTNVIFLLICLFFSFNSFAQETDKSQAPYFFVKSDNPALDQLPLKSTKAEVNIAGVIADVTISQVYKNEGQQAIEAIYVFPGSTKAAVYGMQMIIGNRTITAEIKEKNQARQAYETAKSEGKRASLLEQERPNVFQMNVANIMPGDEIQVKLQYTELLVPEAGKYEFVYPTVVGPRYNTSNKESEAFTSTPYTEAEQAPSYKFDIEVYLAAGMTIQTVNSPSHKIKTNYENLQTASIELDASESKGGNRDFVLQYQLSGDQLESGLLLYEHEDENYFLMMVQPPKRVTPKQIPAREYIFIVDVSGSMRGFPLDISKKLLRDLITGLKPTDKFNVLLFAGTSSILAEQPLYANEANIEMALNVIDNRRGGGGTELLPALKRALNMERCEISSRSIVVITDGYVSVEKEAYDLIRNNLDEANLFSFGIGSGVNRYIIEGMAHVGGGEPLIILKEEGAQEKAEQFRQLINAPVLTQIKTTFDGFEAYDVEPITVPDVLAEKPVVVFGKYKGKPSGKIKISGYSGDQDYTHTFDVGQVKPSKKNSALRYLWAREKIKQLDDYNNLRRDQSLIDEVTQLGLDYNLMTAYTSFVAIDHEVVADGQQKTVKQPLPLPEAVPNSAVGFELGLENVVRSSKKKALRLDNFQSNLSEAMQMQLEKQVKVELRKLKACYGQISGITVKVSVDKSGKISLVDIQHDKLTKEQKTCLIQAIQQWQLSHFNPNQTIHFEFQMNF
jgi:Ca-activated chloride channel family protein